jgi:hypothetical protein
MSLFMLSRTSGKRGFALEHAGKEAGIGKGAAQEVSAVHSGEEGFNRDDQSADCEQRAGELDPTERKHNGKQL